MSGRPRVSILLLVVALGCSRGGAPGRDASAPAADAASAATDGATGASSVPATVDGGSVTSAPPGGATGDSRTVAPGTDAGSSSAVTPRDADGGAGQPVTAEVAALPVTAAAAIAAGHESALVPDGTTVVEPGASFRIEVAVSIRDGRLSLRDEQDAMVPSAGTAEMTAQSTRYQLTPQASLRPGSSYTLHLDGAVTHAAHDATGRAYRPVVFAIRTTGERPAPPPKRRPRGR